MDYTCELYSPENLLVHVIRIRAKSYQEALIIAQEEFGINVGEDGVSSFGWMIEVYEGL